MRPSRVAALRGAKNEYFESFFFWIQSPMCSPLHYRTKERLQLWLSEGDQAASDKHAKPTDRLGRRYRDVDTNVFSIADDEDDNDDNVELSSSDDELINKMVNISSFTQGEGILHSFPCSEIKDDSSCRLFDIRADKKNHLILWQMHFHWERTLQH